MRIRIPRHLAALAGVLFAATAGAAPHAAAAGWTFAIEHGIERSTRSYLLVADAGQPSQRAVSVRSVCHKPHAAEGAYGTCVHTLTLESPRREFTLEGGEDVVVVGAKWGAPLLLATLEYGCCGGPWTARFYDERGAPLGLTQGRNLAPIGDNTITRSFDFHNRTLAPDGSETLLVLGADPAQRMRGMQAITLAPGPRRTHAVRVDVAPLGRCEDWVVAGFDAFFDRKDILLKLEGGPCEVPDKAFSCGWQGDELVCVPAAH